MTLRVSNTVLSSETMAMEFDRRFLLNPYDIVILPLGHSFYKNHRVSYFCTHTLVRHRSPSNEHWAQGEGSLCALHRPKCSPEQKALFFLTNSSVLPNIHTISHTVTFLSQIELFASYKSVDFLIPTFRLSLPGCYLPKSNPAIFFFFFLAISLTETIHIHHYITPVHHPPL